MSDGIAPLADDVLLAAVGRGNEWMRAVLCTLARRGVALRRADPDRALRLLEALAPLPLYKGGQFLFDLMEWEDLMVDGPPPPALAGALDARALGRLADLLRSIQAHLDGDAEARGTGSNGPHPAGAPPAAEAAAAAVDDSDLPPLEPGFHLYQDVALGLVRSAEPLLRAVVEP